MRVYFLKIIIENNIIYITLAKWSVVCRPKNQGGLDIHDLEVKNTALLGKWLFRLLTEDGIWQTILRRKYIGSKASSQVF
jgi:hypothetical protein